MIVKKLKELLLPLESSPSLSLPPPLQTSLSKKKLKQHILREKERGGVSRDFKERKRTVGEREVG